MAILKIKNLSKSFNQNQIIDEISITVPEGSVFGFIGANGAGKTTTMKMILGLLKPDKGEIYVNDEKVEFGMTATNRYIGYLADVPEFYNYMRPKEYLQLCGEIAGVSNTAIKERSLRLLELVGLDKENKKIGGFSRGMKQRLGVAQALITQPKLLICDEPTSALDPIGRKEILDILKQISSETTVIFSTHILSDVERICDRVAVLHGGKIVLEGTLSELKSNQLTDSLSIEFQTSTDKQSFCQAANMEHLSVKEEGETHLVLMTDHVEKLQKMIFELLVDQEIYPTRLEILEPNMENIYLEVVQ